MKKKTAMMIIIILAISLIACGNSNSAPETATPVESATAVSTASEPVVVYADEAFMESLKIGLQNRWDANEEDEKVRAENNGMYPDYDTMKKFYHSFVRAELEQLSEYPSQQFEDTKLQEKAITYINMLNDSDECIDKYLPADENKFMEEWEKIYHQRTKVLKEFVDDYGLTVDEKYQSTLNDLLSTASYVEEKEDKEEEVQKLINSIEFELKEDDDGFKTYSAVVENTTDINFDYIDLEINLLDADGIIIESTYSNVNNLNSGSKARFEFQTMEDFESYDIVASWSEK